MNPKCKPNMRGLAKPLLAQYGKAFPLKECLTQ